VTATRTRVSPRALVTAANHISHALCDLPPDNVTAMALTFVGLTAMADAGLTKEEVRDNLEVLLRLVYDDPLPRVPRGN
jgi:hypothetical protein